MAKEGSECRLALKKVRHVLSNLPDAFEDLTGVIASDLKVIVTALTQRAGERLLLSRRQLQQLQLRLWNNLTQVLTETWNRSTSSVNEPVGGAGTRSATTA